MIEEPCGLDREDGQWWYECDAWIEIREVSVLNTDQFRPYGSYQWGTHGCSLDNKAKRITLLSKLKYRVHIVIIVQ